MNLTLAKRGIFHDPLVDIVWATNADESQVVAIPEDYADGYPAALTGAMDAGLVEETEAYASAIPTFGVAPTWTLVDAYGTHEIVGLAPLTNPT